MAKDVGSPARLVARTSPFPADRSATEAQWFADDPARCVPGNTERRSDVDEVSVVIDAPLRAVWNLVTDVARYGEWSPENRGGRWAGSGPREGARFVGTNRRGRFRWSTHCTVVQCVSPRRFTFEVAESRMRWGYRLDPVGARTRLIEWREHTGPLPLPLRMAERLGFFGRDREGDLTDGMRRTIEGIKRAAEGVHRMEVDSRD